MSLRWIFVLRVGCSFRRASRWYSLVLEISLAKKFPKGNTGQNGHFFQCIVLLGSKVLKKCLYDGLSYSGSDAVFNGLHHSIFWFSKFRWPKNSIRAILAKIVIFSNLSFFTDPKCLRNIFTMDFCSQGLMQFSTGFKMV